MDFLKPYLVIHSFHSFIHFNLFAVILCSIYIAHSLSIGFDMFAISHCSYRDATVFPLINVVLQTNIISVDCYALIYIYNVVESRGDLKTI